MKKLVWFLIFSLNLSAAEYVIDKAHTKVLFHITHLVFNTMTGKFDNFSGKFKYDEDKNILSDVNVSIAANSINTDHEKRDTHLKSEDFFFAEKFPELTFKFDNKKVVPGKDVEITGDLTMRGVTKKVDLTLTLNGPVTDPWGNSALIFKLKGKVDRRDFGISWNKDLIGKVKGSLIGDMAEIDIQGEANPEKGEKK
ncbi:MAG: YceI family protein [Bacteriovoracales bacterium]